MDLLIDWAARGDHDHRRVGKYLPEASSKAASELRSAGWQAEPPTLTPMSMVLKAQVTVDAVRGRFDSLVRGLAAATRAIRFD